MAGSKHVTEEELEKLHQPPEGAGSKGCLAGGHQGRKDDHKCSHQWQAVVKARSHWKVYEVKGKPQWSARIRSNFSHFKKPYWHNAHHIIPSGAFRNAIVTAGKSKSGLANVIKQGLLRATYNQNGKINMVIFQRWLKGGA